MSSGIEQFSMSHQYFARSLGKLLKTWPLHRCLVTLPPTRLGAEAWASDERTWDGEGGGSFQNIGGPVLPASPQ
ncbi:uncharacterized protein LOC119765338 isoform X2 [Culex quinquefasciatus]|uniref:uncharacterized protein LOC119765338 isoform X2 n=1 Tax=Culex quinquefasciatus TaxID=7176 RepID=UPI0018E327EE|nr:uncharacterized protein LOC119765338 isoform X2 [Culex quinquefasciatus]